MDDTEDEMSWEQIEEEQKFVDLERAQMRSKKRPNRKEQRFTKIDGRYIPPPELQKEIDKLNEEKAKAANKGLLRFFKSKDKKNDQIPKINEALSDNADERDAKEIKKLRGIEKPRHKRKKMIKRDSEQEAPVSKIVEEDNQPVKRSSFMQTVNLLNQESARPDKYKSLIFVPPEKNQPNEVFAENIRYTVGVVYWDQHDLLADRVIVVTRVFSHKDDLLIEAYAPDSDQIGVIPASRIVKVYDLISMNEIPNAYDFITRVIKEVPPLPTGDLTEILSIMRYELMALACVSRRQFDDDGFEKKIWIEYISDRYGFIDFDVDEMLDYIKSLGVNDQAFYEALDVLILLPRNVISDFVRTFVQIVLGDGIVQPKQRELLAELLYALRLSGIELNILGLR